MNLPLWPFGGRRDKPGAVATDAHDSVEHDRTWDDLPAIELASGKVELTAQSLDFSRKLAGSLPPELSLKPLVHERSVEVPHGLAELAVRTVRSYAGGEELRLHPRTRTNSPSPPWLRALRARLSKTTTAGEMHAAGTAPEAEASPTQHPAPEESGTDDTPPATPAPGYTLPPAPSPRPVPARALAAPEVRAQPPPTALGMPLTRAPDVHSVPAPAQAAPTGASTRRSVEIAPAAASTSAKSAPPPPTSSAPDVSGRLEPPEGRPAGPLASPIVRVRRRNVSPQPVSEAPAMAVLQELPLQPPASPVGESLPDATAGERATAFAAGAPESSTPVSAPLSSSAPVLAVPRLSAGGARALAAPLSVQRSSATEGTAGAGVPSSIRAAAFPAEPSLSAAEDSLPLAPATTRGNSPFTRVTEKAASPPPLPLRPSPIASLAVQALPLHGLAPVPVSAPASPTAAAASAFEISPPVPINAQRAEEGVAPALAPASSLTEAAAVGVAGGHPDRELDELSGRIYDRIRTRLRTELLIDRERAGLVTDLR